MRIKEHANCPDNTMFGHSALDELPLIAIYRVTALGRSLFEILRHGPSIMCSGVQCCQKRESAM